VRRVQAILLLVAFSFPLISLPLVSLRAEAKLPACCRRDGKHKCSMKSMAGAGLTLKAQSNCPLYPSGKASPAVTKFGVASPAVAMAAPLVDFIAPVAQTEARYRVSYSRAGQKRGPPSLS
jgi:hypothetical protein